MPAAARPATPAARAGEIVESAPTDIWRLGPRTAMNSDAAMNAYKPAAEGIYASLAVAICSGTAMATRVRPATTSSQSQEAW